MKNHKSLMENTWNINLGRANNIIIIETIIRLQF